MVAINFPNSPEIDELFSVGNRTWKWNGTVWQTVTTPTGSQGDKAGHRYEFSDNTEVSQPADGAIKFNNASATAVTTISVSNETKTGIDITNFLNDLDNVDSVTKFYLTISSNDNYDPTFTVFRVGDVTVNSEWTELSVLHISGTTPSNGEQIVLNYDRTGDRGPTGPTGAIGPTGPNSLPSYTGNDGKFLTTDGLDAFWENVDALPLQTGNSGKYLTTDGTDPSWEFLAGAVYQDLEPTVPLVGQIWVDSDASASVLNQNDYLLKTDAAVTYLTPPEAASTYLTTSAAASTYLTSTAANSTYLTQTNAASTYAPIVPTVQTGFRNAIINGGFDIDQRNSGTLTGPPGTYGLDRWLCVGYESGTNTFAPVSFALGEAPEGAYSKKFLRIASSGQSGTSARTELRQNIENVSTFSGQTITISFWAKTSSGTPKVAVAWWQNFGTGGSPSAANTKAAGFVTLSTSWNKYSLTINVDSVSGKTIGTNNNDYCGVRIFTNAGTAYDSVASSIGVQNTTVDIWGIQVEKGTAATPFEQRPIGTELALCQRYYYKSPYIVSPYILFNSGNVMSGTYQFPVTMRVAPPSITYYDGANTVNRISIANAGGTAQNNITPPNALNILNTGWNFGAGGMGGTTGNNGNIMLGSYEASAEL
jgi:hypothetical protein